MYKIKEIDEYSPVGNSLTEINENFSILDTRNCLYDSERPKYDDLSTLISSLSSRMNNFYTGTTTLSSEFKGMADLVNSMKDYWLTPVMLVYPKTFSVLANYQEILQWLTDVFPTTFKNRQLVKVQFVVKSFDDSILNGTTLEKFTLATLDALSSTYKVSTRDIQQYIVLDNHVKSIVATISNILKKLFIKTKVEKSTDLDYLIDSCSVHNHQISSNVLTDIEYPNLLVIWSLLQQYSLIKDRYDTLSALGISAIPSNVITQFNTKNITESFFGDFCFLFDDGWEYIPDCGGNICQSTECDCYGYVDVNKLYDGTDCKISSKYVLYECDDVVKDPTVHIFQENTTFTIPTGAKYMEIHAWGQRGGDDNAGLNFQIKVRGGGGGYSYCKYDVIEEQQYSIAFDLFGGKNDPGQYCPGGGGLCGVFFGTDEVNQYSFNRALLIAGGGGGCSTLYSNSHYYTGKPGNDVTSGGMLSMKGRNCGGGGPTEIGGGGGGYRGGNYVYSGDPLSSPGAGGTGFYHPDSYDGVITPGVSSTTANQTGYFTELSNGENVGGVVIVVHYETNYILE